MFMRRRELVTPLEDNFTVFGPITLGIENEKDSSILAEALYQHYMGVINFDEAHFEQLTQVVHLLSGSIGGALREF